MLTVARQALVWDRGDQCPFSFWTCSMPLKYILPFPPVIPKLLSDYKVWTRVRPSYLQCINLFANRIFRAWKEARPEKEKNPPVQTYFIIDAGNLIRIAIDAGGFDAWINFQAEQVHYIYNARIYWRTKICRGLCIVKVITFSFWCDKWKRKSDFYAKTVCTKGE